MTKYAQFDHAATSPQRVTGWYDTDEFVYANLPPDLLMLTQEQWDSRLLTPYVSGGMLVAAPTPTAAELQAAADAAAWTTYQAQAKAALDASDMTVLRCVENAIAVPTEWATYRASLRAIVGATTVGDPTQPLPTKPAYPAGT